MAEMQRVTGGWGGKGYVPNLWIKYKLTLEMFNQFWDFQKGKCAGCESQFSHPTRKDMIFGFRPEVDHDHKTGKVRGLLCRKCNDLLGKIKDNQELLQALDRYLQRNGERLL